MKYDKMKAVAVMLLGLAGILIAFSFAIAANSEHLVGPSATLEQFHAEQRMHIQICIVLLAGGCFFLYRGAVLWDRASYQQEQGREVAA